MMKKILVPFDGSETALRALEFAAGIGKPFGSEIMVVNVIVPYDYTKVPPRKPKNAIEEAEMAAKEPDADVTHFIETVKKAQEKNM